MDDAKQFLHLQLVANVIKDKCAHTEGILFDEALCSQHRCIRFTTQKLNEHAPKAMYEVYNYGDRLEIACGGNLSKWELRGETPQALLEQFEAFLREIPAFETKFVEGTSKTLCSNRYERSRKARQACLLHHGYACKVCGMKFETVYGEAFKEIIEVHHIVPISQIGKEYVVDPIKDLMPVCPNCHAALHSKPGGTYTIAELQNAMKRIKKL